MKAARAAKPFVFTLEKARLRLERLIARFDISTFPIPTILTAIIQKDVVCLKIQLDVKPRPNDPSIHMVPGDTMTVEGTREVYMTSLQEANDQPLFHLIRQHLLDTYVHEMDEHILVDGKRVFDPHENNRW